MFECTQFSVPAVICSVPLLFAGLLAFVHITVCGRSHRLQGYTVIYRPWRVKIVEGVLIFRLGTNLAHSAFLRSLRRSKTLSFPAAFHTPERLKIKPIS